MENAFLFIFLSILSNISPQIITLKIWLINQLFYFTFLINNEREKLVDDTSHSITPPPKLFGFFSIYLRNCDVGFGFDRLKFPSFKVKTLSL